MAADELTLLSIAEAGERLRRRTLSPVELTRAYLARIQADDAAAHCYITVLQDEALASAATAEREIASGSYRGPLHGIPVALKDLVMTRGIRTTCGSRILKDWVPDADGTVAARLTEAGAILLGKLNMHEFAYGPTGVNPHYGTPANPWGRDRMPGGSSSGSGAAVATGLCAGALGTDTGGSVRIPASLCGIVGLKPTYGRVSRAGVVPLAWSLDHIGPLARTVDDAVIAFEAMAGLPEGCVGGKRVERPKMVRPVAFFFDHVEDMVRSRIMEVLGQLDAAGARIDERNVEGIEYAPATQFLTLCSEACQANWELLMKRPAGLSPDVRLRLEVGQFIGAVDYVKAQRLRRWLRENMIAAMGDAEVLVLPTLPVSIPRQGINTLQIGDRILPVPTALTRLTSPFNFSGLPALSIPCGLDARGLPVGLQLVGRPGADATVLAVGRWCEAVLAAHSVGSP